MDKCLTHFYRYRKLSGEFSEYVERTVCHNELYFPKPSSFNDPFDCRPSFSFEASNEEKATYYKDRSKKQLPNLNREQRRREAMNTLNDWETPEAQKRIQDSLTELITEHVGVLCLSARKDDILMWSHYADSHRGLCLEFDGYFEFFARAQEVNYPETDVRPQINPYRDSPDQMVDKAVLTKASHWKYEEEWRILEHVNGPGVYRYPPEALTGIILGAQIPPQAVAKVLGWIEERGHSIKLYRASPNPTKLSLIVDEVSISQFKT